MKIIFITNFCSIVSVRHICHITEELENTLLAVEKDMRVVKQYFNIPIHISSLEVDVSSTHKSQYLVGETFDMTGLVVLIVYDDYSTEFADMSKVTLELTRGLSKYDRYVTVSYEGTEEELRVAVTVMEEEEDDEKAYNIACDICDSINNGTEYETLNRNYGKVI